MAGHTGHMMVEELVREVKAEVLKPFSEKLERAEQLCKLWARPEIKSCVACSFGKDSLAVLHLVLKVRPDIPVIWENTGVDFAETKPFVCEVARKWNLNLTELKPQRSYWEILDSLMEKGFRIDDGAKQSNSCCYHLKDKPFKLLYRQQKFTHVFTGVTAMESRKRMFTACQKGMTYYQKKQGIWKVHPIMYWREEEVWAFTRAQGIPIHPAYEKYHVPRIGCVPCTSYRHWREQLARVNPRMYKLMQEKYFGQALMSTFMEEEQ